MQRPIMYINAIIDLLAVFAQADVKDLGVSRVLDEYGSIDKLVDRLIQDLPNHVLNAWPPHRGILDSTIVAKLGHFPLNLLSPCLLTSPPRRRLSLNLESSAFHRRPWNTKESEKEEQEEEDNSIGVPNYFLPISPSGIPFAWLDKGAVAPNARAISPFDFDYMPGHCRDNVFGICKKLHPPEGSTLFAVEIKNADIWHQRVANGGLATWGRHMIAVLDKRTPEGNGKAWVLDLESTLNFPSEFEKYFALAFEQVPNTPQRYQRQRMFRVLGREEFLEKHLDDTMGAAGKVILCGCEGPWLSQQGFFDRFSGPLQNISSLRAEPAVQAEPSDIQALVEALRNGTLNEQEDAAAAVDNLACETYENQALMCEHGCIEALIHTLHVGSKEAKAYAASTLQILAAHNQSLDIICAAGGIPPLIEVFGDGIRAGPNSAAYVLYQLAKGSENQNVVSIIRGLIRLLAKGSDLAQGRGAKALNRIATEGNQSQDALYKIIRNEGGIQALIKVMREGSTEAKKEASGTIGTLANDAHNQDVIREAGGIPLLIQVLCDENKFNLLGQSNAAAALANLARSSSQNMDEIREKGGIEPLIKILTKGSEEVDGALLSSDHALQRWDHLPFPSY